MNAVWSRQSTPETAQGDLWFHARSFHLAAKQLAKALELDPKPPTQFDAAPVVFMYRHALELHLKALVLAEGGNFLPTRPDALSIHKTHSVSWLSRFVCQIVTALHWEPEFKCKGVQNLAEFRTVVDQLNDADPGSYVFRSPISSEGYIRLNIRQFAHRIDALLTLLDATADALAATWDIHMQGPVPPLVF